MGRRVGELVALVGWSAKAVREAYGFSMRAELILHRAPGQVRGALRLDVIALEVVEHRRGAVRALRHLDVAAALHGIHTGAGDRHADLDGPDAGNGRDRIWDARIAEGDGVRARPEHRGRGMIRTGRR